MRYNDTAAYPDGEPVLTPDRYADADIKAILAGVRTVALVGASANQARPSWAVLRYLLQHGYRVFPINPGLTGKTILDRPVFGSLRDVPEPVDMVDIFRNSEAASAIVDEALALLPKPKVIWMQLTVRNDEAAARAEAEGLKVVMNRCPKIEFGRLSGEIGWSGINSRIISAKTPKLATGGVQRRMLGR